MTVDLDAYRNWSPDAQKKAMDLVHAFQAKPWRPFYCPIAECNGKPHDDGVWDFPHGRADQKPPRWSDRWRTWLLASGRGAGKTESGSRLTHQVTKKVGRIILVAPTGPDLRETMVEGVSGLLATAKPGEKPIWEPSKKKLTWPNGAVAQGFSAEEPDRLRGPQSGFIWMDEPAHYDFVDEVWDNALFGMRLGNPSHVCCTTTPKPTKWMKDLMKDPRTIISRASTYANLDNLDPAYRELVIEKYEGTRIGRQELHGELLEDVEGALWQSDYIHHVDQAPETLDIVVVAVDPAGTANARSDETGIVVVGLSEGKAYVLEDATGRYSPDGWGAMAWRLHEKWAADCIVAEKNYGGDMVKMVLNTASSKQARIKLVTSRRGKALRAEPIVQQYEKARVFHVGGRERLALLEDEMLSWVPGEGASPNRVDALVHGLTEVMRGVAAVSVANPADVLKKLRGRQSSPMNPMRGRR